MIHFEMIERRRAFNWYDIIRTKRITMLLKIILQRTKRNTLSIIKQLEGASFDEMCRFVWIEKLSLASRFTFVFWSKKSSNSDKTITSPIKYQKCWFSFREAPHLCLFPQNKWLNYQSNMYFNQQLSFLGRRMEM